MVRLTGALSAISSTTEPLIEDELISTPIMFVLILIAVPVALLIILVDWFIDKIFPNKLNITDFGSDIMKSVYNLLENLLGEKLFYIPLGKISEKDRFNFYKYFKIFYKKRLICKEYDQEIKDKIDEEYKRAYEECLIIKIAGLK